MNYFSHILNLSASLDSLEFGKFGTIFAERERERERERVLTAHTFFLNGGGFCIITPIPRISIIAVPLFLQWCGFYVFGANCCLCNQFI